MFAQSGSPHPFSQRAMKQTQRLARSPVPAEFSHEIVDRLSISVRRPNGEEQIIEADDPMPGSKGIGRNGLLRFSMELGARLDGSSCCACALKFSFPCMENRTK